MKGGYLLDTNHLSEAVDPVSRVRDRLQQMHRRGARFGTCVPVLCELEVGIRQTARQDDYRRQLAHLLQRVRIWPLGNDVALRYGEVFLEVRARGRVLSQVDMILAGLTRSWA